MKNITRLLILIAFGYTFSINSLLSQNNVCSKIDVSTAQISSSQCDICGVSNCFDGDTGTLMRTANINPCFVKIIFEAPVSIDSIGVYLGQNNLSIDQEKWWVEAADNENDLQNKSNTYVLAVDSNSIAGLNWDAKRLTSSVERKIWKFNIKRIVGNDYVHIWELALYTFSVPSQTGYKYNLLTEMRANNIVYNNNAGMPADNVFDGSTSSSLNFGSNNEARLLMSLRKNFSINKIRTNFNRNCKWFAEYANSYTDLQNKSGSYSKTASKNYIAGSWDSVYFDVPLNTKHIQIMATDFTGSLSMNEIEFYSDKQVDLFIGLQQDLELWQGWKWKNVQQNLVLGSTIIVQRNQCQWKSSDPTVASVDNQGNITAVKGGNAVITAEYQGAKCSTNVKVISPVKQIEKEQLNSFMSKPMEGCLTQVPVLIVQYLPTTDGQNINTPYSPDYLNLNSRTIQGDKAKFLTSIQRIKFALEEGSRFRKYKNPSSKPNIGIKVVDYITIYEPIPPSVVNGNYDNGILKYTADFERLAEQINLKDYVENKGVKYVWFLGNGSNAFMPHYNPDLMKPEYFRGFFESYMSTPGSRFSCNGVNPEPLPLYNKTYVVINQYMGMPEFNSNNFEPFTHQFEAMWCDMNRAQDGNIDLFWNKFVGEIGRCGWTHTPPNTKIDYGYMHYIQTDPTRVQPTMADIEDWKPDNSGEKKLISYHSWEDIQYNWPDGISSFTGRYELQWFMYWLQSIPGKDNGIPYKYNGKDYEISNWWKFIADWDNYAENEPGLYELPKPKSIVINTAIKDLCSGDSFMINFTKEGNFNPNNYFTVQLSDKNGSFANPVNIGTINSNNSGVIKVKIPEDTQTGLNYRFRIISDNPALIGADNGTNIRIYQKPSPEITGNPEVCRNSTEKYRRNLNEFATHKWTAVNGSIIGCDTCENVEIMWNGENNGLLTLTAVNTTACDSSVILTVNIISHSAPEITGVNSICEKNTAEYKTEIVENNSKEILWKVHNGTIIGDNDKQQCTVKWNNAGAGNLKLFIENENGCLDSNIINVTVNPLPEITVEGRNTVCNNDISEYSSNQNNINGSLWTVENGEIIGNNNTETVTIKWNKAGTGKIKLLQTNNYNCSDSVAFDVVINEIPAKPIITKNDNKLISSANEGNQWYLNGELLPDEQNKEIYPEVSGLYTVQSTIKSCKSVLSDPFNFIINGIDDRIVGGEIIIYPNPFTNEIKLKCSDSTVVLSNLTISSLIGEIIYKSTEITINKELMIQLDDYPTGIYFITYTIKGKKYLNKLIKL